MGTVVSLREFRERRARAGRDVAGVTDPAGAKAAHRPRERSVEPRDREPGSEPAEADTFSKSPSDTG